MYKGELGAAKRSFDASFPFRHLLLAQYPARHKCKDNKPQQSFDQKEQKSRNPERLQCFHVGNNRGKGAT